MQSARLYALTPDAERERILDLATAWCEGGVDIVQLRHKTLERSGLLWVAERLRDICHRHQVLFIVNDHLDIALLSGADGVHLAGRRPVAGGRGEGAPVRRVAPDHRRRFGLQRQRGASRRARRSRLSGRRTRVRDAGSRQRRPPWDRRGCERSRTRCGSRCSRSVGSGPPTWPTSRHTASTGCASSGPSPTSPILRRRPGACGTCSGRAEKARRILNAHAARPRRCRLQCSLMRGRPHSLRASPAPCGHTTWPPNLSPGFRLGPRS